MQTYSMPHLQWTNRRMPSKGIWRNFRGAPANFRALLLVGLVLMPHLVAAECSSDVPRHPGSSVTNPSASRSLLQQAKARQAERAIAASHNISSSQVLFVGLTSLASLGLLSYMGWKVIVWYQHRRRPGYVELQSLETYHQPWSVPL